MSWETVELGNICDITNGSTPLRSNADFWENGKINWFTIDDIRRFGRQINQTTQFVTEKALKETSLKLVQPNTVLLCCTASVGEYAITKIPLTMNQQFNGLILKTDKVIPEFLFHYCSTLKQKLISVSGSTTINFVAISKLKKITIPIPPLATQQKIVAKLDAIFAEIDKATAAAEANAKNAEALFQSYLDKLFEEDEISYKKVNIKDVCKIGDGNHSSKYPKKDEMVESGVPFIRSTNIVNGVLSDKDLVYLTEDKHKELKKGHLKTGDVLITNRGEIGKVAIVDERFDNANLNSQIAWLRCNPALMNQYLLFFLMSANMKKFYSDTKTGAALQQLPIGKIEKIQIPLPSLDAQKVRCSEFLTIQQKCSLAIFSYQNKLIKLSQFKQSILKQAFSGELVRD